MGHIIPVVTGVKLTYYYFVTDNVLLCKWHARGESLQPFTNLDKQAGFGKLGCPFCNGGALYGKFHLYRSRKAVIAACEKVERDSILVSPTGDKQGEG